MLSELSALLQVIVVDLVLAGDNAIIVGMVAAGLPREQRARVIFIGIAAATLMRVGFAVVTSQLLQIIGLTLAGGILLLWVCWKLWRELRHQAQSLATQVESEAPDPAIAAAQPKTFRAAVIQIVVADLSMSLDNVLAVAGVAIHHVWVLAIGLMLSIGLMGVAANLVAKLLNKHPWISYAGVFIVLYVACSMIYNGGMMMVAPG